MFDIAITKQQKLVKLAKKLTKNSKLVQEKTAEYLKTVTDPTLIKLAKEQERIGLEEIAIHFDAVKKQINNFSDYNPSTDYWKLDKPAKAEGTVFTTSESVSYQIPTLPIREVDPFKATNHQRLKPFLQKAIAAKEKRGVQTRLDAWYEANGFEQPASIIRAWSFMQYIENFEYVYIGKNIVIISRSHDYFYTNLLVQVAKKFRTNILIRT